ncbi:MAG: hypothetical protein J6T12_08385 [Salinivirgaceae bacterium]|nr:hypothetical protein [Salinivirgaceae bacterium]
MEKFEEWCGRVEWFYIAVEIYAAREKHNSQQATIFQKKNYELVYFGKYDVTL